MTRIAVTGVAAAGWGRRSCMTSTNTATTWGLPARQPRSGPWPDRGSMRAPQEEAGQDRSALDGSHSVQRPV